MRKKRHKTTYKPNHELSRFALICDKQTELSECARWPVCQTTHCSRKQTELSKLNALRGHCAKQPFVMHSYLTLSYLLHLHTY